eukprot:m.344108 g.344108  ORF g.344108 m.344108 type:complete len:874 (+) comp23844_c0_seq1:173-2794(+)
MGSCCSRKKKLTEGLRVEVGGDEFDLQNVPKVLLSVEEYEADDDINNLELIELRERAHSERVKFLELESEQSGEDAFMLSNSSATDTVEEVEQSTDLQLGTNNLGVDNTEEMASALASRKSTRKNLAAAAEARKRAQEEATKQEQLAKQAHQDVEREEQAAEEALAAEDKARKIQEEKEKAASEAKKMREAAERQKELQEAREAQAALRMDVKDKEKREQGTNINGNPESNASKEHGLVIHDAISLDSTSLTTEGRPKTQFFQEQEKSVGSKPENTESQAPETVTKDDLDSEKVILRKEAKNTESQATETVMKDYPDSKEAILQKQEQEEKAAVQRQDTEDMLSILFDVEEEMQELIRKEEEAFRAAEEGRRKLEAQMAAKLEAERKAEEMRRQEEKAKMEAEMKAKKLQELLEEERQATIAAEEAERALAKAAKGIGKAKTYLEPSEVKQRTMSARRRLAIKSIYEEEGRGKQELVGNSAKQEMKPSEPGTPTEKSAKGNEGLKISEGIANSPIRVNPIISISDTNESSGAESSHVSGRIAKFEAPKESNKSVDISQDVKEKRSGKEISYRKDESEKTGVQLRKPKQKTENQLVPDTLNKRASKRRSISSIGKLFAFSKSNTSSSNTPNTSSTNQITSERKHAVSTSTTMTNRKPGAVTVAEIEAGLPEDDEFETLDPRAVDAAKWTDKVVRELITEIQKRGTKNDAGQHWITFGKLFDETANIFDALVGILKTAKKYKVVDYEGMQLWQGQDDNVVITLLKDTHDGVVINRRKRAKLVNSPTGNASKTKGFGASSQVTQNEKCVVCGKTVYPMEYMSASDKVFHRTCFRCFVCKRVLKPGDYATVNDTFYCMPHYTQNVLAAGGAGKEHQM